MKVQILLDWMVLLKFLFMYLILMNLIWASSSIFLLLLKKGLSDSETFDSHSN